MSAFSLPPLPAQGTASSESKDTPIQPAQWMDATQRAKVDKAAVQFEGLFIHQMLKEMRRSAEQIAGEDAIFKGQSGNGLLDIADTMLADAMAGQRAFGIADTIVKQMVSTAAPANPGVGENLTVETAPLKFSDPRVALPLDRREAAPTSSNFDHQGPLP